jgi:hypothetical protein
MIYSLAQVIAGYVSQKLPHSHWSAAHLIETIGSDCTVNFAIVIKEGE